MDQLKASPTKNAEVLTAKSEPQANAEQALSTPAVAFPKSPLQLGLRRLRAEAEIHAIGRALEQTGWNRRRAAQLLSISYRGLLYKIRQYEITATTASKLTGLVGSAEVE
jgi:DNA-binding NtrC family response regulator